jgi:hypothetical protein
LLTAVLKFPLDRLKLQVLGGLEEIVPTNGLKCPMRCSSVAVFNGLTMLFQLVEPVMVDPAGSPNQDNILSSASSLRDCSLLELFFFAQASVVEEHLEGRNIFLKTFAAETRVDFFGEIFELSPA